MATLAENYKSQLAGPAVAGDIKSIKLNIAKLVTIQGGTPATKASSFFNQSKTKENAYESSFLKKKDTSPTQVSKTSGSSGGSFFDSIGGFFKSLLTGGLIAGAIAVIGKILEDEETRKSIKGLLVDTFEAIFNGIKNIITFAGEALSDPKVILAIINVFVELGNQLWNIVKSIDQTLKNELGVPGGLLSVIAVGGTLYVAFGLLLAALGGLTTAASIAAAAWGAKIGGSIGPGTKPGVPGTTPPGTTPPGTKPGSPGTTPAGTKPGFAMSAEEKIAENKAKQMAAEKGAARAAATRMTAKSFGRAALGAVTGPIGGAFMTAMMLYDIANLLTPSELAAVETHTQTLESIQEDVDDVVKNYNDGKITEDGYNRALQGLATKAKTIEQRLDALKKQIIKRMQEEGQDTSSVKKTFEDSEQRIAGNKSPTPVSQQASVRAIDNATIKGSGATSPTAVSGGTGNDNSRNQIEAYLGKKISDAEYDALLRVTGAEAASSPMERAAVASVILNRAKKAGGDIIGVLNAPYQFQAVTGPDGKSGTTDNPHSANAKKVIPGIEKQIADNIALVPKGLDSFTSAVSGAYKDVGGQAKFDKKMAEMQSYGGQQIGQTVFASMGGSVKVASAPSQSAPTPSTGTTLAQQSQKDPLENALEGMMSSIAALATLTTQSNKTNQTPVSISSGGSSGGISSTYDNELIQTLIGLQSASA
jgi:hypothetical protein